MRSDNDTSLYTNIALYSQYSYIPPSSTRIKEKPIIHSIRGTLMTWKRDITILVREKPVPTIIRYDLLMCIAHSK